MKSEDTKVTKEDLAEQLVQCKSVLIELYAWDTGSDRSGNPYTKPAVDKARTFLGDPSRETLETYLSAASEEKVG